MGQYHKIANLDKKQLLNPHRFGVGIKLLEFSESRVSTALCALLAVSNNRGGGDIYSNDPLLGSWGGDRIAIIGDYWEEDEAKEKGIPTWEMMGEDRYDEDVNHIGFVGDYEDISLKILKVICEDKWIRQDLLADVARYDWGRDWTFIFTKQELEDAKKKEGKDGL